MMVVKVDLYLALEGKDFGARTSPRKGGHGDGKFVV